MLWPHRIAGALEMFTVRYEMCSFVNSLRRYASVVRHSGVCAAHFMNGRDTVGMNTNPKWCPTVTATACSETEFMVSLPATALQDLPRTRLRLDTMDVHSLDSMWFGAEIIEWQREPEHVTI